MALIALPETRPERGVPPLLPQSSAGPRSALRAFVALGHADRRVLLAAGLFFAIFFVSGGVLMSTIGLYLGKRWAGGLAVGGVTVGVASMAGGMLALRSLLGIAAGPAAGALSDRLRSRWPVVGVGLVLGLLGFVLLSAGGSVLTVAGGVALVALSGGALIATLAAAMGDLAAGSQQGLIMGALATAGDAGSASGPFLAYALAMALDLRWVYALCAALLAGGLVATVLWGRERRA